MGTHQLSAQRPIIIMIEITRVRKFSRRVRVKTQDSFSRLFASVQSRLPGGLVRKFKTAISRLVPMPYQEIYGLVGSGKGPLRFSLHIILFGSTLDPAKTFLLRASRTMNVVIRINDFYKGSVPSKNFVSYRSHSRFFSNLIQILIKHCILFYSFNFRPPFELQLHSNKFLSA